MTPQKITEQSRPVFPCWLWNSHLETWVFFDRTPVSIALEGWATHDCLYTHFHPNAPTAPTVAPEEERPTPAAHDEPPFTEAAYYLRKRSLYYRPKAAGYTASEKEAGLFSYAYAFADQQATAREKDPADRVEMVLARYALSTPSPQVPTPRQLGPETVNEMADLFCRWPLPYSVCADRCATEQSTGRTGTNLLSYIEAREMIRAVVGPYLGERVHALDVENSGQAEMIERLQRELAEARAEVARLYRENEKINTFLSRETCAANDLRTALAESEAKVKEILTGNKEGSVPWVNERYGRILLENVQLRARLTAADALEGALREIRNSAGEQVMVTTSEGHSFCVHTANAALWAYRAAKAGNQEPSP